jgi:glycosyltransferase 2 family protein
VRPSRRSPPDSAPQADPVASAAGPAGLAAAVAVEDQLEPRIRLPTDLLRCVIAGVGIALLVGLGLLAQATATGVEVDVYGATNRLPKGVLDPLHTLAFAALLVLPVALAGRLVYIGQLRRLAEAIAVGLVASGLTIACDAILTLRSLAGLYKALAGPGAPPGAATLDPYLAGLAAFLTVIGMASRPRWRTWFWLAIVFYCLTSLVVAHATTTVLSLLVTLLIGSAVGSGLRYAIGTHSERPTALEIAAVVSGVLAPVVEIRRVPDSGSENRRYAAVSRNGARFDITVFDRDQQAADAFYRIYRRLRLTTQASRSAPLTVERAIERRGLLTYAVEDAGVATPHLRALLRAGPEAGVLVTDQHRGTTLAELPGAPSDKELGRVFDAVLQLHRHRVTHRALIPEHILLDYDGRGRVMLLDPGEGDVAASDLQLRLDLAQLTAALALVVGADRAADLARRKISAADLGRMIPLLQPVVLHRSTRAALRKHADVLPELRKRLVSHAPDAEFVPEQLERIRLRSVLTLVASIFAAYIIIGELGREDFGKVLRQSDWRWVLVALALSAATYVGATWSLTGFVLEKLNIARTFLAQLAGSFVVLVTPAAVGGVAVNIRYLNKSHVEPADAASSVGVSQVFAFALHIVLLAVFAALAGATTATPFHPPEWAYLALAGLGAVVLVVLAIPAGRRLVRSRVAPALGQVIPRLLDITQKPAKLAEGVGGALLLSLSYILCLEVSLRAVGGHAPFFAVGVVYLTGSAIGSFVPTPGGLGAVELALTTGLITIGHVHGAAATSAVLLFRLVTFWLPVPLGWAAMSYLQRHDAL